MNLIRTVALNLPGLNRLVYGMSTVRNLGSKSLLTAHIYTFFYNRSQSDSVGGILEAGAFGEVLLLNFVLSGCRRSVLCGDLMSKSHSFDSRNRGHDDNVGYHGQQFRVLFSVP